MYKVNKMCVHLLDINFVGVFVCILLVCKYFGWKKKYVFANTVR
jgi:hypothetical protein